MKKSERTARLEELAAQVRVCEKCPLSQSRTIAVPGDGPPGSRVMLIGEAPGRDEDTTGHPFVGAAGHFLNSVLEGSGIRRDDLFITNIVKCRPPENRSPRRLEIETCTTNYLFHQIELINPQLIILLGGVAAKKVLGLKTINEARGPEVSGRLSPGSQVLPRRPGRKSQRGFRAAQTHD